MEDPHLPSSRRDLLLSHRVGQPWTTPGGQSVLRARVDVRDRKARCAIECEAHWVVAVLLVPSSFLMTRIMIEGVDVFLCMGYLDLQAWKLTVVFCWPNRL